MPVSAAIHDLAQRYAQAWSSQDPASVAACYALNGSLRVNDDPPAVGRAALTELARGFMQALPDLHLDVDGVESAAHGVIIFKWTLTGHNTGPSGTGRRVHISGFEEWKLAPDGLIAESQGHMDTAEYQRQLGP